VADARTRDDTLELLPELRVTDTIGENDGGSYRAPASQPVEPRGRGGTPRSTRPDPSALPAIEGDYLPAGGSAGAQPLPEIEVIGAPRAFGLPTEGQFASAETIAAQIARGQQRDIPLPEAKVTAKPRPSQLARLRPRVAGDIGFAIVAEHLLLPWAFERLGLRTGPTPAPAPLEVLEEIEVSAPALLPQLPTAEVVAPALLDVLEPALVSATRPTASLGPRYGVTSRTGSAARPASTVRSDLGVADDLQVSARPESRVSRPTRAGTSTRLSTPTALPIASDLGLPFANAPAPRPAVGEGIGAAPPGVDTRQRECSCDEEEKPKKKQKRDRKKCYKGTYTERSRSLSKSPRVQVSCITGKEIANR